MRWRALFVIAAVLLLPGCRGEEEPPLSHGKPVDYWLGQLKKPDPKLRKRAVAALGHVGTADPAVLPALQEAVKDRAAAVRDEAVLALFNIGPEAMEAVETLRKAEEDKDPIVRAHATTALERILSGK
jgi:HEAT repeat protein